MKSCGRLLWVCLFGAALLAFTAWISRREVPVYQGKTLCEWIAQAQRARDRDYAGSQQEWDRAQNAIRALGTNALPWLMADLQAPESR